MVECVCGGGGCPDLEAEEGQEGLDAVEPAIDEIAHKEVICLRTVSADLKELEKVKELAVNVPTRKYGGGEFVHDGERRATRRTPGGRTRMSIRTRKSSREHRRVAHFHPRREFRGPGGREGERRG